MQIFQQFAMALIIRIIVSCYAIIITKTNVFLVLSEILFTYCRVRTLRKIHFENTGFLSPLWGAVLGCHDNIKHFHNKIFEFKVNTKFAAIKKTIILLSVKVS